MIKSMKALTALFGTKTAKLVTVIILAGLMATSSAAVFTQYYANTTATVKTAEVMLTPGTDPTTASGLCSVNNATTGAATVGITLYERAPTYYTDLLRIHNSGQGTHTIQSITITDVSAGKSELGSIVIYYRTSVSADPATGALGSCTITSSGASTSNNIITAGSGTTTQTIATGVDQYIAIVAYAKDSPTIDATVTFKINIQWI